VRILLYIPPSPSFILWCSFGNQCVVRLVTSTKKSKIPNRTSACTHFEPDHSAAISGSINGSNSGLNNASVNGTSVDPTDVPQSTADLSPEELHIVPLMRRKGPSL
jgi:hypothetical protein